MASCKFASRVVSSSAWVSVLEEALVLTPPGLAQPTTRSMRAGETHRLIVIGSAAYALEGSELFFR